MEQENQRIQLTKRLLKESLLRLLQTKDIGQISVSELCNEAGINRTTFYRHYRIPDDVMIEIERDLYRELKDSIKLPTAIEDIQGSIEQICTHMQQKADIFRLLLRNSTDKDFSLLINEIYDEIWREYQKEEFFKNFDAEDIRIISLYNAGGCFFILRHWLMGNIQKSPQQMAEYLCRPLIKTLTALSLRKNKKIEQFYS